MAGSPAGIKRSPKSMLPSLLKSSKPIYLYDTVSKQLIYIFDSHMNMAKGLAITNSNLSKYTKNNNLYLARFIISITPLDSIEYSKNLLDIETLKKLVKDVAKGHRITLSHKNLSKTREEIKLKASKAVKLINLKTNEVLTFDSRIETARYLKGLNPNYKCSAGVVSDGISKGRIYKKTFKLEEIS